MKTIFSLLPLNTIPTVLVLLVHLGIIELEQCVYIISLAATLIFTLSFEMFKAAAFAIFEGASWLDFVMSLLLLLFIMGYMMFIYVHKGIPSADWWLVAEAQLMDVMIGFYIAIRNARRDINIAS